MGEIKRIIFDLDGTLIPWKDEYASGFNQAVREYNLDIDVSRENEMYTTFEDTYTSYTVENMIEHFKNLFNVKVSNDFIMTWLTYLGNMSEENKEINEVLEYLSKKYELAVLTNGFGFSQEMRLEHAGIRNYFKDVIGGDKYIKPNPNSFKLAMGTCSPEECLMIGDSLEKDILGALKVGLNVIYLTKKENIYDFPTIKDIRELKRIL